MPSHWSRRGALTLWGAAMLRGRLFASSEKFWNTKDPSQWSDAEIQQLISDSPWAKPVKVRLGIPDPAHDARPWSEAPPIPPRRPPDIIPRLPTATPITALVRCESAQPILDALKLSLPDAFLNCHVIGVSSDILRGLMRAAANRLDDLKPLAILQPHGRDPVNASIIAAHPAPIPTLWFGFPKKEVRLLKNDSEVRFSTSFNGWVVEAKFDSRQMVYRGTQSL